MRQPEAFGGNEDYLPVKLHRKETVRIAKRLYSRITIALDVRITPDHK